MTPVTTLRAVAARRADKAHASAVFPALERPERQEVRRGCREVRARSARLPASHWCDRQEISGGCIVSVRSFGGAARAPGDTGTDFFVFWNRSKYFARVKIREFFPVLCCASCCVRRLMPRLRKFSI